MYAIAEMIRNSSSEMEATPTRKRIRTLAKASAAVVVACLACFWAPVGAVAASVAVGLGSGVGVIGTIVVASLIAALFVLRHRRNTTIKVASRKGYVNGK